MSKLDIEAAIANPSSFFSSPNQVMQSDISDEDKIKILQSWENDLNNLAIADAENMAQGEEVDNELLSSIHHMLGELGALDD